MNEDLLGKCRACGQVISKDLLYDACPKCGQREPHLTAEVKKRRMEEHEQEGKDDITKVLEEEI